MKKFVMPISLIFIISLLIIPLTHAAQTPANETSIIEETSTDPSLEDALNQADKGILGGIKEKSNNLVEKEIAIPESISPWIKTLTRFEDPITISQVVIALGIMVLLVFILNDLLQMSSSGFNKMTSIITTIVAVLIISAIGMIKIATNKLIELGNVFKLLESWSAGAILFWIILIIIAIIILQHIARLTRERKMLIEARKEGVEAATVVQLGKSFMSTLKGYFKSP